MPTPLISAFSKILLSIHSATSPREVRRATRAGLKEFATIAGSVATEERLDHPFVKTLLHRHRDERLAVLGVRPGTKPSALDTHSAAADTVLIALGLTKRECEVLSWISHGKRDAEVAKILGISVRTVGKHVENILPKLGAETRTAAAATARRHLSHSRNSRDPFPRRTERSPR